MVVYTVTRVLRSVRRMCTQYNAVGFIHFIRATDESDTAGFPAARLVLISLSRVGQPLGRHVEININETSGQSRGERGTTKWPGGGCSNQMFLNRLIFTLNAVTVYILTTLWQ